ncbi:unnamed protein product [Paramecium sonneborni]|uniref:Homeodomain protein n=1 Tax=Paramecium sonneborni TaxID=65129 RepID=A0A8S1JTZ9_9CILI|nr:unnamed protein product [Paramecium sonneborni]
MQNFQDFLNKLNNYKEIDIPCYYRNQFKTKQNSINSNFYEASQILINQDVLKLNKKWDQQSKQIFILIMIKYFQMKNKKNVNPDIEEWRELKRIFGIEEQKLKQKWITLITPMTKSLIWEKEEDDIIKLQMNVKKGKHIWTEIALELYNHNNGIYVRTPKQIRERWMNYLNPILKKSSWTDQEDIQLLSLVIKNGKKWSKISKVLNGRTENQVKNRFKSLVHRIYQEQEDDIDELLAIKQYLSTKISASPDQQKKDQESKLTEILPKQKEKDITEILEIQKVEKDIFNQQKKVKIETEECEQNAVKQDNYYNYLLQQLNNQFIFSTQGNYDSQSLENRSSISDLNYFGSLLSSDLDDQCIEQNGIKTTIFPDSPKIQDQQLNMSNNYIKETGIEKSISNICALNNNLFNRQDIYKSTKKQISNLLEQNSQIKPTQIVYSSLCFDSSHLQVKSTFQSPLQSSTQCIQQQVHLEQQKQNQIQDYKDLELKEWNDKNLIWNWKNKIKQDQQNVNE